MTIDRPLNILLVEDEELVHQIAAGYLRDLGHRVDKVHDALAALESIEARNYDLALVDIRMPGTDGLSFLTKIQEIRLEMSVVIITGYGNMDMVLPALRLGAADFLMKPIKLLELDAVLEKSVRLRKLIVERMRNIEALQKASDELEARSREQAAEVVRIDEDLHREITKRKQAEKALQESEKR